MPGTPFEPMTGSTIGRYEVLSRLSVGGMAEVFLAAAPGVDGGKSLVALKRILPDLRADKEFVQMFLEEARISSALAHRNIARVFELEQTDDLFLVMEFVQGQSLGSIVRAFRRLNRPIPLGFAMRVLIGVCE